MNAYTCDECGEPAVVYVNDLREEREGVTGPDGRKWKTWEVTASHFWCGAHQLPGKVVHRASWDRDRFLE